MSYLTPNQKEVYAELNSMLGVHLSNTYTLMLRLQNFHWNVEGPHFRSAHEMFEEHYTQLWEEVDIIAERIRTLGSYPPASLKEFQELSPIADRGQPLDYQGMLQDLITCVVVVRQFAQEALKTAGLISDEVTADMLIKQLEFFEKCIWMYHSSSPVSVAKHAEDSLKTSTKGKQVEASKWRNEDVHTLERSFENDIHNSPIPQM